MDEEKYRDQILDLYSELAATQAVLASTLALVLHNQPDAAQKLAILEGDLQTKRIAGLSKPNAPAEASPAIGNAITRIFRRARKNLGLP